jgi:exopolyphosphatase/guanosine-5'-triphosphate,3'-diphosphate pyrophosphatase
MPDRYASIDIGTNTVKLTIAERENGNSFAALVDTSETTRLGEGIHSGRLREGAIRRTLECLEKYANLCRAHQVRQIAAVGTSALRDAVNQADFLQRAEQLGIHVHVISGDEEARLSFLAVSRDPLWRDCNHLLVLDIGGGSSEMILGGQLAGAIEKRMSFQMGAVRLTEAYLRSDPPSVRDMAEANEAARMILKDVRLNTENLTPVGVGGTFVNMAAVKEQLEQKHPELLHGVRLTAEEVESQVALFASLTIEERKKIIGLDPARADIILGGVIILSRLLSDLRLPAIRVSVRGLRWGVLYDRFGVSS